MIETRVPTRLERQGKSGKIKWQGKVVELFFQKCQGRGTFFSNADYYEIEKCCDFHLKNVAIIILCSR